MSKAGISDRISQSFVARVYNTRNKFSIVILIGILIAVFTPSCGIVLQFATAYINSDYRETRFCTFEDEVFQEIEANSVEWVKYYQELLAATGLTTPSISFSVASGVGTEDYTVDARLWLDVKNAPILVVVTERHGALSPTFLGEKGYFYSPTGKLPEAYAGEIESITALRGDIYCYITISGLNT